MQLPATPQLIKYKCTPIEGGVLLWLWEPAPVNEDRVRPFLFMAKYRLTSIDEAKEVLEQYLSVYQH